MKKVIRHLQTGHYFTLDGQWTDDLRLAQVFETLDQVSQAKREHNLNDVELLYSFGDTPTKYDFAFPLL